MKNKKRSVIATIAVLTAVVGVIVAVGAYLKKKAVDISEKLDFDGDLYYEDEDYFDEDINSPQDLTNNNTPADEEEKPQQEIE